MNENGKNFIITKTLSLAEAAVLEEWIWHYWSNRNIASAKEITAKTSRKKIHSHIDMLQSAKMLHILMFCIIEVP